MEREITTKRAANLVKREHLFARCMQLLPAYIDDELAGVAVAEKYPQVANLIETDPSFAETYTEAREIVVELERDGLALPPTSKPFDVSRYIRAANSSEG